jgi:ethylbenzene dioxygenase ferredoxin subunit
MNKLCKTDDVLPDVPVAVELEGFPPLAVYCAEAGYFVTDNVCTHGEAALTDGCQEGTTIECPFHHGTFDIRTGKATHFPCTRPIKTYQVSIEDGWICI